MQTNAEKLSWPHPLDPARREHTHLRAVEADPAREQGAVLLGEIAMAALSVTAGLVAAHYIRRHLGGEGGGQA